MGIRSKVMSVQDRFENARKEDAYGRRNGSWMRPADRRSGR